MAYRVVEVVTNFTSGELDPLLVARNDTKVFRSGAEKLTNYALLVQGAVRTRPGTTYLTTPFNTATSARTEPFVFSATQRYVFVFYNGAAKVYLTDGTLATTLTISNLTTAMLPAMDVLQSGDTMFLFHQDLQTVVIKRTGALTFTVSNFAFEVSTVSDAAAPTKQPYYRFADLAITLAAAATTGTNITLVASAAFFTSGMVGNKLRIGAIPTTAAPNPTLNELTITAFTDTTHAKVTITGTLFGTTATTNWDEQAFSAVRGWPCSGDFYQNRLVLGGSKSVPAGLWISKSGAYFNYDLGTGLDNEAMWESVPGSRVAQVRYVVGGLHILIFTDRALYYIPISGVTPAVTPGNVSVVELQPYGSTFIRPEPFDGAILFGHSTGAVMREALWAGFYSPQAYTADPVSLLGSQLISNPKQMAALYGAADQPEQYAFLVNGDGTFSVFHSVRSQNIAGWTEWVTTGSIQSVCVCDQQVFALVQRTIAGSTVVTLEVFDDDKAALDCAKQVTLGSPGKTFTGFTHLENQLVSVVSNGHPLGDYTVSNTGTITLDALAPDVLTIEAGLPYTQLIRPMPARFGLPTGISTGMIMGLIRTIVEVDHAASFQTDGQDLLLNFVGDDFASDAPTVTDIVEVRSLGYDVNARADIVVNQPVKITVMGLTREVAVNA